METVDFHTIALEASLYKNFEANIAPQGFKLGGGQVHTPRPAMPLCGSRGQHSAAAGPQADRLSGMHPLSKSEITSPTITIEK
eukprot:scaffold44608_cov39-Prasinocladus_malaysianus.AAC.1